FPESPSGARFVILSEATAKALFGRTDIVGQVVRVGPSPQTQTLAVAGVARDAIITSPQRANTRIVYLNRSQFGPNGQEWPVPVIRERAARAVRFPSVEGAVRDNGHEYVSHVRTIGDQRDIALSQERLLGAISSGFAAIGLALVVVGVFGLLSYG